MVDEADKREENGLAGGSLDDGGFADAGGVEVDVGAFFGGFFFDVEVKDLDDVADEVGELPERISCQSNSNV